MYNITDKQNRFEFLRKRNIVLFFVLAIFVFAVWTRLSSQYAGNYIPVNAQHISGIFYRHGDDIWGKIDQPSNFAYPGVYEVFQIKGVDAETFTPLDAECPFYSKDKEHVFYKSHVLEGAHSSSSACLLGGWGDYIKDAQGVYFREKLIALADVASFGHFATHETGVPHGHYMKDNHRVYYQDKEIPSADLATFELGYSREQRFGYANPHQYALDGQSVYYLGKKITHADPKTFRFLSTNYWRDAQYVWWQVPSQEHLILEGADAMTFEVFGESIMDNPLAYAKDAAHVYQGGKQIDLDSKTFRPVAGQDVINFVQDKTGVYCFEVGTDSQTQMLIEQADPETFVLLNEVYAKDKQHVFYSNCKYEGFFSRIIPGADPATFEVVGDNQAKDKYHNYKKDSPVSVDS